MQFPDNVKFLAAKPFQTEFGEHQPGDVVKQAKDFFNLEALIRSGFLYPYAPEDGYAYLPPHLFSELQTRKEALAKIEGDVAAQRASDYEQPGPVKLAERQAEQQHDMYQLIRDQGDLKLRAAIKKRQEQASKPLEETVKPKPESKPAKKAEPEKKTESKPAAKKTAAKRTTAKKTTPKKTAAKKTAKK